MQQDADRILPPLLDDIALATLVWSRDARALDDGRATSAHRVPGVGGQPPVPAPSPP